MDKMAAKNSAIALSVMISKLGDHWPRIPGQIY